MKKKLSVSIVLAVIIVFSFGIKADKAIAATTITSFTASSADANGISELSWRTSDYTKAEISFSCPDTSMTLYVPEDRRTVRCDKGGLATYTIPQNYNVIGVRANPQGSNVYVPVTFTLTLLKEGANGELFSTGETRSIIAQLPAAGSTSTTASCAAVVVPTIQMLTPNGNEIYTNDQIIPIIAKIQSAKTGSVKLWLIDESNSNVFDIGTTNGVVPGNINCLYTVNLNLPILRSMNYSVPAPSTMYRAVSEWKSADGIEWVQDGSNKQFTIKEGANIAGSIATVAVPQVSACPAGALFNPMTGVRCSVASIGATLTAPSFGSIVSSTIARPTTLSQDLSVGSRGDQVLQLQQILVKAALLAPDNATGYFGNMTLDAVKKFQAQKGLPIVGRVGPLTRTALSAY